MRMTSMGEPAPLRGSKPERPLPTLGRRWVLLSLVSVTIIVLIAWLTAVLLKDGLSVLELAMVLLFALNLPWITTGLWNAVIGFIVLRISRDGVHRVVPLAGLGEQPEPPSGRIAIVVPMHNEDAETVLPSLRATVASLDATGRADPFDIFLLSDTQNEFMAARERALFAAWKRSDRCPARLRYRRRADNAGFKAGNVRDFCVRCGGDYQYMIVLDADSIMSGAAILRMAGLMQANPRLGILQTLIVGLPSISPFARIFQFGMRHGMRVFTVGGAWWQGDAGPYWGHNAIIRLAPFVKYCRLPEVPGRPPLGGEVLSHDQLEAVLMRRAGWEVRVLPIEDGSFEANPPTLLDFIKRDLRWCHGNMQYTRLLGLAGANRLGRLQMLLAILMYTSAPRWVGFWALGLARFVCPTLGLPTGRLLPEPSGLPTDGALAVLSVALFIFVVATASAPKLFGVLQALSDRAERRKYGGAGKLLGGAAVEFIFSILLAPVMIVAQTIFMTGLLSGRRQEWPAQRRGDRRVSFGEAARRLWPQTLLGFAAALLLMFLALGALPWAGPILAGLLVAIPFAMATTSSRLGRLLVATGFCATPEELHSPSEVCAAPGPATANMADPAQAGMDAALATEAAL